MQTSEQKPKIVARNLENLMDLMNHESIDYQKAAVYGSLLQDSHAKQVVDGVRAHHKQSFDALHQYLEQHQ